MQMFYHFFSSLLKCVFREISLGCKFDHIQMQLTLSSSGCQQRNPIVKSDVTAAEDQCFPESQSQTVWWWEDLLQPISFPILPVTWGYSKFPGSLLSLSAVSLEGTVHVGCVWCQNRKKFSFILNTLNYCLFNWIHTIFLTETKVNRVMWYATSL